MFDCFPYHANLTRFFHLLLSVLVKFNNCAGNKGVRYETNSLDFKVRADGTMYAAHRVQMPSKQLILMVTAWDPQILGRWEAIVRFLVTEKSQHSGHKVRSFKSSPSYFILPLSVFPKPLKVTCGIRLFVLPRLCFLRKRPRRRYPEQHQISCKWSLNLSDRNDLRSPLREVFFKFVLLYFLSDSLALLYTAGYIPCVWISLLILSLDLK